MKNLKNVIIAVLTLVMVLTCTGCNAETGEAVNIAFVVGIVDNETKINEGIEELSTLPAQPGSDYAFISIEGVPACIGKPGTITDLSNMGYTDAMMDRIRAGIKADLVDRLASYKPSSAQIDMARAIELSVHQLTAHAVEGRKNILVFYCSGKSSTGLINMVETPIYKLDLEASVHTIAEKMNLDMSNIDEVIWYCCGDFGGKDQPALSFGEKAKMKAFYKELFVALGIDEASITFKDNLPSNECYQFEDTPVSCMAVEGTVSGLRELVALEPEIFEDVNASPFESPIVIPESKVQYLPDSAKFLNPEAAAEAIQPVADFLLNYPDLRLVIYSTVAGDGDCEWLSTARSEKVKSVLTEAGIDESRIIVVNLKIADDIYYQFGLGTGAAASVNRKTVIMDMSTELAQQVLAHAR